MPSLSSSATVRPYPGEKVSGDAAFVLHRDDRMLVVVCDGLGHGRSAHEASQIITSWVGAQSSTDVADLAAGLHTKLRGTIGAAIGIGCISHSDKAVRFVGVGNTVARILGKRTRTLISRPGTLGIAMRSIHVQSDTLEVGDVLILHSDGVSSSFGLKDYPGLLAEKPEIASTEIVRRFGKYHDDASCIVVKCEHD